LRVRPSGSPAPPSPSSRASRRCCRCRRSIGSIRSSDTARPTASCWRRARPIPCRGSSAACR
jgi:hypothetical protein